MHAGLVATAAASLLADQVSKLLVRSPRVRVGVGRGPDGRSAGARPFGARAGLSTPALWLIWLVLAAGALLAPAAGWLATPGARTGLGLALGGAAGNLVDVSVRGGVVDFIDLRIWPAFNVADVAIVAGVVVALASG